MPIQIENLLTKLQDTSARNRLLKFENIKLTPSSYCFISTYQDFKIRNNTDNLEDLKFSVSFDEENENKDFKNYFVKDLSNQNRIKIADGLNRLSLSLKKQKGINTLFLTIGETKWKEDEKQFNGPLILVPVKVTFIKKYGKIASVDFEFNIEEEVLFNPALMAKLKVEASYNSEINIEKNIEEMSKVLRSHKMDSDFENIKIGLYPGSLNYPIWKQLRENIEIVKKHSVVSKLLEGKFEEQPEKINSNIDRFLFDNPNFIVTNADDTQLSVVRESLTGKNLVVIGPPGTGKSETIVNILNALAVKGKKVLFVCDKLTALEVVKKRLDKIEYSNKNLNLGDFCLSLFDSLDIIKNCKEVDKIIGNAEYNTPLLNFKSDKYLNKIHSFYEKISKVESEYSLKYKEIVGLAKRYESKDYANCSNVLTDKCKNPNDLELQVFLERISKNYEIFKNPNEYAWGNYIDTKAIPTSNKINQINTKISQLLNLDQKLNSRFTQFDYFEIDELTDLTNQNMTVLPSDLGSSENIVQNINKINSLENKIIFLETLVESTHLNKKINIQDFLQFASLDFKIDSGYLSYRVTDFKILVESLKKYKLVVPMK